MNGLEKFDKLIRTAWKEDEKMLYISIIDIVGAFTTSRNPKRYWNYIKSKMTEKSMIRQIKMRSHKYNKVFKTDAVNLQDAYLIIRQLPSADLENFNLWISYTEKSSFTHRIGC